MCATACRGPSPGPAWGRQPGAGPAREVSRPRASRESRPAGRSPGVPGTRDGRAATAPASAPPARSGRKPGLGQSALCRQLKAALSFMISSTSEPQDRSRFPPQSRRRTVSPPSGAKFRARRRSRAVSPGELAVGVTGPGPGGWTPGQVGRAVRPQCQPGTGRRADVLRPAYRPGPFGRTRCLPGPAVRPKRSPRPSRAGPRGTWRRGMLRDRGQHEFAVGAQVGQHEGLGPEAQRAEDHGGHGGAQVPPPTKGASSGGTKTLGRPAGPGSRARVSRRVGRGGQAVQGQAEREAEHHGLSGHHHFPPPARARPSTFSRSGPPQSPQCYGPVVTAERPVGKDHRARPPWGFRSQPGARPCRGRAANAGEVGPGPRPCAGAGGAGPARTAAVRPGSRAPHHAGAAGCSMDIRHPRASPRGKSFALPTARGSRASVRKRTRHSRSGQARAQGPAQNRPGTGLAILSLVRIIPRPVPGVGQDGKVAAIVPVASSSISRHT